MYMHKQSKSRVIQALVSISVCPLYRFVYVYITHERQVEAIHMIANNNQNHVCRCTDKIQTNLFNVQKYEYYFE